MLIEELQTNWCSQESTTSRVVKMARLLQVNILSAHQCTIFQAPNLSFFYFVNLAEPMFSIWQMISVLVTSAFEAKLGSTTGQERALQVPFSHCFVMRR